MSSISNTPFSLARRQLRSVAGLLRLSVFLLLLGCSGDRYPNRVEISGKVEFDSQAVQDGRVRFIPTGADAGPVTVVMVKEGLYETSSVGGVPVGQHRVEIIAYDPKEMSNRQPGFGQPAPRQLLPAKFNTQSELAIDVPAGSDSIVHDFVLAK